MHGANVLALRVNNSGNNSRWCMQPLAPPSPVPVPVPVRYLCPYPYPSFRPSPTPNYTRTPNSTPRFSGSGIYRHVRLAVRNALHFATWGVAISTPEVRPQSSS